MSNSHEEEPAQRSQYTTPGNMPSAIASSSTSSVHKRVGSTSPSTLRKIQTHSAPSRNSAPMASSKRQRSGEGTLPTEHELDLGRCSLSGPRCAQPRLSTTHRHFPWCHALVPQVERLTLEICDGFLKTVSDVGGRKHAALALKCRNVDQIKDVRLVYPEPRPVTLIGSMGAGKSQLTNAILGLIGVAITSDSTRGTNTILEFRTPKDDQTTKFVLEIVCYSADQIKGQLWGYICKIHAYFQLRVQTADAGEDADFDPSELEEQRKHYSTACTILLISLCGSNILGTPLQDFDTFKNFLEVNIDGRARIDDPELIGLCDIICENVTAFLESQGVVNDVKTFEVDDIDALEDAMYETIRPPPTSGDSQQHLWPLVRKAVVHYDSKELLNLGVVIADTPGLQDTNETIVDNTLAYLAAAGTILLAAPVTRIAELTEIDEYLQRCIKLRKAKNVVLVATKADMLADVLKPADRKKLSLRDENSVKSAEDEISAIEQELADREGEKSRLVEAEEWKAVHNYTVETPDLKSRKARAVRKRTRAVRQITRINLESQLKGKLRDLSHSGHGPDLKVVFTSAQTLEQHVDGSGVSLEDDELEDTGVPSLTRMLFEQPARERFDKLWKTCTVHIPTLLTSITNLMSKSPDQTQMDARARLNNIIDAGTDAALTALDNELAALFAQCVQAGFTTANKASWIARIQLRLDTWLTWHPRTVHAFCKRNGHWKRNGTRVSWNETIRRLFTNSLDVPFTSLNDDVQSVMSHFADNLNDHMFKRLHEDVSVAVLDPRGENLRGSIATQQDALSAGLKGFLDPLRNVVEDVRLRAVLDGHGSYVHDEMQASYTLAAYLDQKSYPNVRGNPNKLLPGQSALADRIDTLRTKLSQPGANNLFERVEARLNSDFDEGRQAFLNKLSGRLAKVETAIMDDFDSRYGEEGEEVPLAADVAKELATAAQHALRRFKQDIQPMLEQCKKLDESGSGEP